MTEPAALKGKCAHCGAQWQWVDTYWLVADVHGRLQQITLQSTPGDPLRDLSTCPICGAKLKLVGSARVEEVKSEP